MHSRSTSWQKGPASPRPSKPVLSMTIRPPRTDTGMLARNRWASPHPVGHVGHWEAEAQGGPALVGRRGEKKLYAGLHILGTPLSKF